MNTKSPVNRIAALLCPLLLALCVCPHLAAAAVDSTISSVTVYADRAVVTRSLSYKVEQPGTVEVVLDRLPAALVDESLQVAGSGTAQATLLDVTPRVTQVDFTPNDRVRSLEDDIRQLRKQAAALDDRGAVLSAQKETLNSIEHASTQAPTKDAPRLSLDDASKLLAFLEEQRGKISTEERSISDQKEDLAAKQGAAERQLAELRGAGTRSYKSVTVRFDAANAGSLDLTLSYAVRGASWGPSYDARASGAEGAVSLGYFGFVRQNTGEDWNGVALTLSTARPSAGGSPAPLRSWIVDILHPEAAYEAKSNIITLESFEARTRQSLADSSAAPEPAMTGGSAGGYQTVEASFAKALLENQVTSASFRIPVAVTVPSDNSPQKVPITTIALAAKPEYLAIPKHVLAAFLTDKVTNTSDFPLIAGPMNVFLDGTLVASSRIATVMPGEKFDLALGADEGISLKRKLNSRFTEDAGIVSKRTRITYDFTLTVQNNKRAAATISLLDQVPVSRNEKIVVTIAEPTEDEAKREADGTVKWTLDLQPGEKRELPLKFSVEYPSDIRVTGLE
jgi:uncharacterized protein (TIGR02231 family)